MGVALPALFAACTADEIVPQQDNFKTDLDKRAVVGEVVLNFGGAETRAALGDNSFNSIKFESGKDGIGARIIDKLNGSYNLVNKTAFQNYTVVDEFASSNYQYVNHGKVWASEALMVEGNYMFYFPYNAKNVARTPVEIVLPLKQTVKPADKEKGYNNPIAELYAGENPSFVGYKFIEAKDQTLEQTVDMQHIFAYPQITLVNKYTTTDPITGDDIKHPITVEKIILVSSNIIEKATIKHTDVVTKLNGVRQMSKDNKTLLQAVGSWTTSAGILDAKTSDIATFSGTNENAEVVFEGGLTLEPDQKYAFNVVLPAATYAANDLKMYVYLSDDKMFQGQKTVNTLALNYGPGKRFPKEEYDFPAGKEPSVKATAGALATVELKGNLVATKDPAALIKTAAQFENMLKGVTSNNATLQEVASVDLINKDTEFALGKTDGVADLVINDEIIAMLDTYLSNGKINFITKVQVEGNEAGVNLKNMAFGGEMEFIGGKATVTKGVTARATAVKGGVLTIASTSNALLNNITVNAGELVVKKNEFTTGNANNIIVGQTLNDDNKVIATGKVSLVPATNSSIEISGAPANFSMTAGELVIGEKAQFNLTNTSTIANAKVTNNGTLYVYADYEVPAGVTLENNGAVTFNTTPSTQTLSNAGTIENYSDLVLKDNKGTINVKQGSHTTVATNTGLIDNSEKAYVAITTNSGTVNYTFNNAVNVDDLDALVCEKYSLNKLTFKGKVTVDKPFKATSFYGISKLEFAQGSELYLDAQVGTSVTEVLISSNVKWGGFAIASSGLGFKNAATVTVKKNCTLTVTGLTVTGKTDSSLTFKNSGETIDTTAGEVKGAVHNNGRVAGAKQDGTDPVTWTGTALEATEVFP